jgi:hypothetical protein
MQGWKAHTPLSRAASTGAMEGYAGRHEPAVRTGSLVSSPGQPDMSFAEQSAGLSAVCWTP